MQRRDFLIRGTLVVGGLSALGGCTEQSLHEAKSQPPALADVYDEEEVDLPVRGRFEVAEMATLEADGTTIEDLDGFRTYLDERGLSVESLEEAVEAGERLLRLEYAAENHVEHGSMYHLGIVAGGYAALVAGGYETEELVASLHDPGGGKYGEFRIATDLAERYLDGDLTAAEYAGAVAHTVESSV